MNPPPPPPASAWETPPSPPACGGATFSGANPSTENTLAKIVFEVEPSQEIMQIVDGQGEYFALQVLGCVINSPAFYDAVRGSLCVAPEPNKFAEDFNTDLDNSIYRVVADYYATRTEPNPAPISDQFARVLLDGLAAECRPGVRMLLGPDEVDAALARLVASKQVDVGEALPVVTAGFHYWLQKRRVLRTIRERVALATWHPGELVEALQQNTAAISAVVADGTAKPFGAGLDTPVADVERISTGLRCLDGPLGGGLARGEFSLFIAGTGVGKTVVATQLAAHFATMGLRGLLITTEEPRRDLELRMVSNRANLPYKRIQANFDPRLLRSDELERYNAVRLALDARLTIVEWLGDRSRSVSQDLDGAVRKAAPVDFVVLDWIGGALGETKPDLVRQAFKAAADKLADIARIHNVICVGLAQAHPAQSRNRAKVDSTMLCECKTMGQRATNIIGMSGLEQAVEDGCESERIYQDRQFFNISKCRKSKGGLKPFIRDFDYQRIRDV